MEGMRRAVRTETEALGHYRTHSLSQQQGDLCGCHTHGQAAFGS